MSIAATYVDANTFTVEGDQTVEFHVGRRVRCDCGVDGIKYGTITDSTANINTTVNLSEGSDDLTANLVSVKYGIVGTGVTHSVPIHGHAGVEGDGGNLDARYYTRTEIDTWRNGTTQVEMGYVHGVTSDIQTQLNAKAPIDSPTFTTSVTIPETAGVADYDKFLVADGGVIKYRTGDQVLSDISAAAAVHTHDDRYYTETEVDTWRNGTTQVEMGYVHGVTSDIQTQLDARCLESVFGDAIGTGLLLDGTTLKVSTVLQTYHGIDPSASVQALLGAADDAAIIALLSGDAGAAFNWNSQDLTGLGTLSSATGTLTIEATAIANNSAYVDGPLSPQVLTGCVISAGTNPGTMKVSAGTIILRTTDSDSGVLRKYSINETDNIALAAANTIYYMQIQYNGGSPIVAVNIASANGTTNINIGQVMKEADGTQHFNNGGYRLFNGVAKLHHLEGHLRKWQMCEDITIGDNGDKSFNIAGGHFYRGINEFTFNTWDSSGIDRFTYVLYYGGAWHYVADQQEIDVDNYNDVTDAVDGLANCTKYKCDWVFVHPDDSHVYVVYGQDDETIGKIEESTVPTLPDLIDTFGALIGRIIVDGGVTAFHRIEMINVYPFIPSPVIDHNNLSNIDGGAVDEYYHLTNAQHTVATQAATDALNGYMTSTYAAKLDGIEATADVTDFDNVQGALAAATGAVDFNSQNLTGIGTISSGASVLTIDETVALSAKAPIDAPTFTTSVTIPETAGVADYDKFLVVDSGVIKYRTGAQVLSDIGAVSGADYLRKDGTTELSADWDIGSGMAIKADAIRSRAAGGLRLGGYEVTYTDIDFTNPVWTEVDPNTRITVAASKVDWAGLARNEDAYVCYDFGAAFFDGDFRHEFEACQTAGDNGGITLCWCMSNDLDDFRGLQTNNKDALGLYFIDVSGVPRLSLRELTGGAADGPNLSGLVEGQLYYITIVRDESIGTNGTLYCYVYSDADRTVLVGKLQKALTMAATDFRYLFACNTYNDGSANVHTGYTQNLRISTDPFGVEKGLYIHDDGRVDINMQSGCVLQRVAAWSAPHNSHTQITYDTIVYDIQNEVASGRFTSINGGRYHVVVCHSDADTDKLQLRAQIRKNGVTQTEFIENSQHTFSFHTALSAITLTLDPNDYIDGYVYQYNYTDGGSIAMRTGDRVYMSIAKVA